MTDEALLASILAGGQEREKALNPIGLGLFVPNKRQIVFAGESVVLCQVVEYLRRGLMHYEKNPNLGCPLMCRFRWKTSSESRYFCHVPSTFIET